MRRAPQVAALVCAAAVTAAVLVVLLGSNHRRTATASSPFNIPVHVDPGKRVCQPGERLPAGTGYLAFFPRSYGVPAGPLRVVLQEAGGRFVSTTSVPAGRYGPGPGYAKLGPVRSDLADARVCIDNAGTRRVDVNGGLSARPRAQLPHERQYSPNIMLRLDYLTAARKSWLSFSPDVARRYALVKATFFGSWTFWLAMALLAAVCLGSVLYAGRELSR